MEHPSVEHLVAACHLGDLGVPSAAHVFVAPFPCRLAAAGLVATGDVPESEESYVETTLVRRRAGEVRPIVSKTTRAETGEGIGADTYWHFDVCAWDREARRLATGAVVSLETRAEGAPPGLTGVLVVLRYEPM